MIIVNPKRTRTKGYFRSEKTVKGFGFLTDKSRLSCNVRWGEENGLPKTDDGLRLRSKNV